MKARVTNKYGVNLGVYDGVNETAILDALSRDVGYKSFLDIKAHGFDSWTNLSVERIDDNPEAMLEYLQTWTRLW